MALGGGGWVGLGWIGGWVGGRAVWVGGCVGGFGVGGLGGGRWVGKWDWAGAGPCHGIELMCVGQLHATRADSEGDDLSRLHARVAAVSELWAAAQSTYPDNLRGQVRHVFEKSGLIFSPAFVRRAGETGQADPELQALCCQDLAAFAEAHLDLPVVYEAVSPTHAIVIAGFARAFGRSCVVYAISCGKGEEPV